MSTWGTYTTDFWDSLTGKSSEPDRKHALSVISDYVTTSGPETLDCGIELDPRYDHSQFIYPDGTPPGPWEVQSYNPSTRPGSRAPHMFLKDGSTSIYDLLGAEVDEDDSINEFLDVAQKMSLPLNYVALTDENRVHSIWQQNIVLVRPDTHVDWRTNKGLST
ncbi:hypothetical protein N7488_004732 [Penicillium malachiteum]|nr:hypothetical protein N7488_004732 [Penicillium malachiteum]